MTALPEMLRHPANRGSGGRTVVRWTFHNLAKLVRSGNTTTDVRIGDATIRGPIDHPTICLATYVKGGVFDHEAMWMIRTLGPSTSHFIDIGANIGSHSAYAASHLPTDAQLICAEPNPTEFAWLEENTLDLEQSKELYAVAVSHEPGELSLNLAGPTISHMSYGGDGMAVPVTSLDLLTSEIPDRAQCLVKIDVEGWEPAVVVGGREFLMRTDTSLILEANGQSRRSKVSWTTSTRLLRDLGYLFVWPLPDSSALKVFPDPVDPSPFGNYIVVKTDGFATLQAGLQDLAPRTVRSNS